MTGCGKKKVTAAPPRPAEVAVLTITAEPVTLTQDLPGRTSAFRVAEVRARVSGIVLKRLFTEGSDVSEGQVLYEIDPAPYQASLDSALGTLGRAEANLKTAMAKENRFKQLADTRAISKQDYDDAVANQGSFEADVISGHAAEKTARINLSYTEVTAPFAGRIGISQVTEGAYVQDSAANLLVTIQQIDKLYVDVTQASGEFLRVKEALANGKLKADAAGKAQVQLILEDGRVYPDEGTLEVSDVTVNAATNTVTVRAIFPNPRGDLLPGLFVRARLDEGSSPDAILVPQNAVTRNTKGEPTAMILGANNMAEVRVLKISRSVGNQWLVTEGLKPGEKLIVTNLQKVRPGAPVKPSPFTPALPATAAAP